MNRKFAVIKDLKSQLDRDCVDLRLQITNKSQNINSENLIDPNFIAPKTKNRP